jgi:hypothetical protein
MMLGKIWVWRGPQKRRQRHAAATWGGAPVARGAVLRAVADAT